MFNAVSQPLLESGSYDESLLKHSPHSDVWKTRQFRESRAMICRWNVTIASAVHRVPPWPDGVISAQAADTPSACTQHTDREQSMSAPEICQNNHHLQNKSVILMDNSGKNKQRWLLFLELFIAAAARAVSSAVLHDRSSLFPHLSTLQSVKETAAVMCINASLLSHETQCMPFTLLKIFFFFFSQGKYDKLRSVGTVCGMLVHSEWDKSSPKMTFRLILLGMLL